MTETIVLLPGLQADGRSWLPLLNELVGSHAICIPQGHQNKGSMAEMSQHALAQSPTRFHLIGWSMGGYIALEILRRAPERVATLTLIATTAAPESAASLPCRSEALKIAEQDGLAAYQANTLQRSLYKPDKIDPSRTLPLIASSQALGLGALQQQTKAIIARPDHRGTLAASTIPLMVIAGTHDQVIPVENSRAMKALRRDATYHELSDCGHCPPLEFPEKVGLLIKDWLGLKSSQVI